MEIGDNSIRLQAAEMQKAMKAMKSSKPAVEIEEPTRASMQEARELQKVEENEKVAKAELPEIVPDTKAYFKIDEDDNVIVVIVDSDGKLVRQIPPEEFLETAKMLRQNVSNLLDVEV